MTFTEWYISWLDKTERIENSQAIDTVSYHVRVPGTRRELLTLFLLIVAGFLLGPPLALYQNIR
jgi:hypothetical protein